MKPCKQFFLSLLMLQPFFGVHLHAQRLQLTVYRPSEEAQTSAVTSLLQDAKGWIWACNNNELIRYDAHRFTSFRKSKPFQNAVLFNCFDTGEEIWVRSDKGILKVKGDSLVQAGPTGDNPDIQFIYGWEGQGKVFLGKDGLYKIKNNIWVPFITETGLELKMSNPRLFSITKDVAVTCLYNRAIVLFDAKRQKIQVINMPLLDILKDHAGNIFLLNNEGDILQLTGITGDEGDLRVLTKKLFNTGIRQEKNTSFLRDRKGNFWVAAQFQYLVKTDSNGAITKYTEKDGLPGLWFSTMFFDSEENLWISYFHGICKLSFGGKNRFTEAEGLWSSYSIFVKDNPADSFIWVGTKNGLNIYRNNNIEQVFDVSGEPLECEDILVYQHRYFGVAGSTLFEFAFNENKKQVTAKKLLVTLPDRINDLAVAENGCLFISGTKGVYAWYKKHFFTLLEDGRSYRKLFIDSKGAMWAGILDGELLLYDLSYTNDSVRLHLRNWFVSRQENNPDPPKHIRAIIEDASGTIWVGTRFAGLYSFREKNTRPSSWEIQQFTINNGLNGNEVWDLSVIKNVLWIATGKGINSINTNEQDYTIINESRGRQIFEVENIAASGNGTIIAGAYPGVIEFKVNEQTGSKNFQVFLTRVGLHTKDSSVYYNENFPVVFDHYQNNLTVNFSANTFINEDRVLYSYKLEKNGEGQWSTPASIHTLSFSSLSPGKYMLSVKARNVFGSWSSNEATWSFVIRSPYWQRWWFYALITLFIAAGIFALYHFRIRQLKKVQYLRDNISRNLHDDIGATLSNINILNELAKRHIKDEEIVTSYLAKSGEDIQRISEGLSDIVWNINPRYDDLQNLFIRMKRYAADMMDGKNISYELVFPDEGEKIFMTMEKRRDLYLVFKEAVNNLVKYSKATKASVLVRADKKIIQLIISDNGVGFDSTKTQYGNGLTNMHQRAFNNKAKLQISSEPGRGTKVKLEMHTT